jgi:hypothetical protein
MYKKLLDIDGSVSTKEIKRTTDGATIPINEDNRDDQEYLAWVAEGNTPEEAE